MTYDTELKTDHSDDYLSDRFGSDIWLTLSSSIKAQLLVTAFRWIYNYPYYSLSKDSNN